MTDDSLKGFWLCCLLLGAIFTVIVTIMSEPARGETAQPQVKSIEIVLKRDRRRSPKFLKVKQRKEQGNAATEKPND